MKFTQFEYEINNIVAKIVISCISTKLFGSSTRDFSIFMLDTKVQAPHETETFHQKQKKNNKNGK